MGKRIELSERLKNKTNSNGPIPAHKPELGPCWLWTGYRNADGYGVIRIGTPRINKMAHRVTYEFHKEPVPGHLQCDHLCRVRSCVNPNHIEIVTGKINNKRSNSPSAKNAAKTHCQAGHEFTQENTHITVSGARTCRICRSALKRKYTLARNPNAGCAMSLKTHCPKQHEYTFENTKIYEGRRFCRQCQREQSQIIRDKRRFQNTPKPMPGK